MAHEFRHLAAQPRETLTIILVSALVSAVFFVGLFLFFKWRDKRRRGASSGQGFAVRQAKAKRRRR
jgi:Flp pilus assembly protein protease CpaA